VLKVLVGVNVTVALFFLAILILPSHSFPPPCSLSNINQLPNAANYEGFAYHVELLAQFKRETEILGGDQLERRHSFAAGEKETNSVHGSDVYKKLKSKESGRSDNLNNSWHLGQTGGSSTH